MQAVFRLGGRLMKEECDDLRYKNLDQSNVQIMHEIHISHVEIENLKADLGIVHIKIQDIKDSQQNWQFQSKLNKKGGNRNCCMYLHLNEDLNHNKVSGLD